MGIIDKTTWEITCDCGAKETKSVVQKGSAYGGSWGAAPDFELFETRWSGRSDGEPWLEDARCKACSKAGSIKVT